MRSKDTVSKKHPGRVTSFRRHLYRKRRPLFL
jgi:hypothetical protein